MSGRLDIKEDLEFYASVRKFAERSKDRWENVTDFEIAQIRDFRESVGVDLYTPEQTYISVNQPIKGWCDMTVAWDDEFGGHLPFQQGWYGYGTEWEGIEVAFSNAIEQELPLDYVTVGGQHIWL